MNETLLKDALYNLSSDSGANADYCKGIVVGMVSTLMAIDSTFPQALQRVERNLPANLSKDCWPKAWLPELDQILERRAGGNNGNT